MTLWLDAQLPPLLAGWINSQGWGIEAVAIRDLGLRDASDSVIFQAARAAGAIVMTKDRDFIRLGNCSNAALQSVLMATLPQALAQLRGPEVWIEIRPRG
jgi:predicted nuclease of predicted toxin-antitoxin system